MATWKEIEADAPAFAARVRACFEAGTNKTLATLRRDGAPRISASEAKFEDGEVTLGMMGGSRKLADVRRDARAALHTPTLEPPPQSDAWLGDAKLSGSLIEINAPPDSPHVGAGFFRFDVTEVALTYLGTPADHLAIESWHPEVGWRRTTRA
jgi:hypothetical protein